MIAQRGGGKSLSANRSKRRSQSKSRRCRIRRLFSDSRARRRAPAGEWAPRSARAGGAGPRCLDGRREGGAAVDAKGEGGHVDRAQEKACDDAGRVGGGGERAGGGGVAGTCGGWRRSIGEIAEACFLKLGIEAEDRGHNSWTVARSVCEWIICCKRHWFVAAPVLDTPCVRNRGARPSRMIPTSAADLLQLLPWKFLG